MYVGVALNASAVRALGMDALRECKLRTEGADSQFVDANGNDCAWFQASCVFKKSSV